MDYTEKKITKEQAVKRLEKIKEEESKTTFHMKRISPTTVVYCKRKERLDEYDKIYNKRITIDDYGR